MADVIIKEWIGFENNSYSLSSGNYSYYYHTPGVSTDSQQNSVLQNEYKKELRFITEIPRLGKLKNPLPVYLIRSEDGKSFELNCPTLNIVEMGETEDQAYAEFFSFLSEDYKNLMEIPEEEMHPSAKQLKRQYQEYIG